MLTYGHLAKIRGSVRKKKGVFRCISWQIEKKQGMEGMETEWLSNSGIQDVYFFLNTLLNLCTVVLCEYTQSLEINIL